MLPSMLPDRPEDFVAMFIDDDRVSAWVSELKVALKQES
jgi:hypothetical protein